MNVSWSRPAVPNGVITEYTLYIDLLNGTTKFEAVSGAETHYIVTDLGPYQLVQVGVSASTEIGEGPRSESVEGRSQEAGTKQKCCVCLFCCLWLEEPSPVAHRAVIIMGYI